MPIILIKNKQFNYTIKKKSIRSINLRFLSPKSFYISCHFLTPGLVIRHFIHKHSDWIYKNSQKFTPSKKLKSLKTISIIGDLYHINFLSSLGNKIVFHHLSKTIDIYTKNFTQKHLHALFEKYFRPLSKKIILSEIHQINFNYKKHIKLVSVRNQKTRFGSCSSRQTLSFNWQIIFFPQEKFRHIICHELVHLKIKNHQKAFYQELSLLDPNWQQNNRWLKTEAKKCFLI